MFNICCSDSLSTDCGGQSIRTGGAISNTVQPSPGCQSAWLGTSAGQLSMADVVRLGRHSSKGSHISSHAHQNAVTANSNQYYQKPSQASAPIQTESHHNVHPLQNDSNVSRTIDKPDISVGQHAFLDEWPVVEHPTAASGSSVAPDANIYSNQPNHYDNGSQLPRNRHSYSVQASDGNVDEYITPDHIISASASSGQKSVTNDSEASHCDDIEPGSASNLSDPSFSIPLTDDVTAVSSAAAKLHHLSVEEASLETNSAVVLPSHLQALAANCSHLSFGTYKAGHNSASAVLFSSNQLKDDSQEASRWLDGLSAEPLERRHDGFHLVLMYRIRTSSVMSSDVFLASMIQFTGIWNMMLMSPLNPCITLITQRQMV